MSNIAGVRWIGKRDQQEDYFSTLRQNDADISSDILITISDGMGGHAAGDVASLTVVRAFEASFLSSTSSDPARRLNNAIRAANQALADRIDEDAELEGMGCTLIGAIKLHNRMVWISVGDSHLYLFRKGRLTKLNENHSMMGAFLQQVERGQMTLEEAKSHPRRNALLSAIMGSNITILDENEIELEEGDLFIFATDGLDTLSERQVTDILLANENASPKLIVEELVRGVKTANKLNQDNTTVVACYHTASTAPFWREDSRWRLKPRKARLKLFFGVALAGLLIALLSYFIFWESQKIEDAHTSETSTRLTAAPDVNPSIDPKDDVEIEDSISDSSDKPKPNEGTTEAHSGNETAPEELIPSPDEDGNSVSN